MTLLSPEGPLSIVDLAENHRQHVTPFFRM